MELKLRPLVFQFLDNNPKAKIKDLRKAFKGESENSLATYLQQWRKLVRKKNISKKEKNTYFTSNKIQISADNKINEETLEALIAGSLTGEVNINPQILRTAVDFLVKVKGVKSAEIPDLALEKFLEVTNASHDTAGSD